MLKANLFRYAQLVCSSLASLMTGEYLLMQRCEACNISHTLEHTFWCEMSGLMKVCARNEVSVTTLLMRRQMTSFKAILLKAKWYRNT